MNWTKSLCSNISICSTNCLHISSKSPLRGFTLILVEHTSAAFMIQCRGRSEDASSGIESGGKKAVSKRRSASSRILPPVVDPPGTRTRRRTSFHIAASKVLMLKPERSSVHAASSSNDSQSLITGCGTSRRMEPEGPARRAWSQPRAAAPPHDGESSGLGFPRCFEQWLQEPAANAGGAGAGDGQKSATVGRVLHNDRGVLLRDLSHVRAVSLL